MVTRGPPRCPVPARYSLTLYTKIDDMSDASIRPPNVLDRTYTSMSKTPLVVSKLIPPPVLVGVTALAGTEGE